MNAPIEYYTQALTEGLPDGIWAFDKEFNLVLSNAAFLDLRKTLYGIDLVTGDSFFKGVPENVIQKWLPVYNEVFKGKRIIFEDTRSLQGNFRQVRISITPVHNQQNEIIGCMGITIDISQEKDLEQNLKKLKTSIADITHIFSTTFKQSLLKFFALQEQLSQNFDLDVSEKTEIIRLAAVELELIGSYLQKLNELELLIK
jgi:PAS domain S-box-containing protein